MNDKAMTSACVRSFEWMLPDMNVVKTSCILISCLLLSLSIGVAQDFESAQTNDGTQGTQSPAKRIGAVELPPEENNSSNELNSNPAMVVGPKMDGLGQPRAWKWRNQVLDTTVTVEGLALGMPPMKPSHMPTQRVIYEGGIIFVKSANFKSTDCIGKLVRVTGTLRLQPASVSRFDGHKDVISPKYYFIDCEHLELLDRVSESVLMSPELTDGGADHVANESKQ